MRKTISIVLCAAMALCVCSCSNTQRDSVIPQTEITPEMPQETMVGMANPMTEYSSLEEVNSLLGCSLCTPGVMGVSDEKYFIIDSGNFKVGQYDFNVNGIPYTLRFSPDFLQDISGYYTANGTAFSSQPSSDTEYFSDENAKLARWIYTSGQYCLMVEDKNSMTQDTFNGIVEEFKVKTFPGLIGSELSAYYESLCGQYFDSYSQRASAEVTTDGQSLHIVVLWGSSAFETCRWTMNAARSEDGLLYYSDCIEEILTYDQSGNESVTQVQFPSEGFFGELDGVLAWNGSGDEGTSQCSFEKAQ